MTSPQPFAPAPSDVLHIQCWSCATALVPLTADPEAAYTCPRCAVVTHCNGRIFRSLSPSAAKVFSRFAAQYEFIRASEGRGSLLSTYYLELPFMQRSHPLAAQWAIRAGTYQHMLDHIILPLAATHKRPLRILDLGAGNGWLSYRLALLGHQPVAVDLLTNPRDGLGAALHYQPHLPSMFPRIQADLNELPFADISFDLAIFNASFHYAEDFAETLAEAFRCLRPGAQVVIADTPWYRHEEDGLRMVAEKHARFRTTYGFASNSIASREFLTPERLRTLSIALDLRWRMLKPWYGFRWALRPLLAKLRRQRTPSKFRIFTAERTA